MSFLLAFLTGLGVGSGGLYILYLTLFLSIEQAKAQGLNLLFFITASFCAAIINLIKKRVALVGAFTLIISGIPFSLLGSYLAHKIDNRILSLSFSLLMILVGASGLLKKGKK